MLLKNLLAKEYVERLIFAVRDVDLVRIKSQLLRRLATVRLLCCFHFNALLLFDVLLRDCDLNLIGC